MTQPHHQPMNAKSVSIEYRDQRQKRLDAEHRRRLVMGTMTSCQRRGWTQTVFFELIDALDLWDDLLTILRKRQRALVRNDLVQLVELRRDHRGAGGESGGTSVTR